MNRENALTPATQTLAPPIQFSVPTVEEFRQEGLGLIKGGVTTLAISLLVSGIFISGALTSTLTEPIVKGIIAFTLVVALLGGIVTSFGFSRARRNNTSSLKFAQSHSIADTLNRVYNLEGIPSGEYPVDKAALAVALVGDLTTEELNNPALTSQADAPLRGRPVAHLLVEKLATLQLVAEQGGWRLMDVADPQKPTEIARKN